MKRVLIFATAIYIAIFIGTSILCCTSPEIKQQFCEAICDTQGRECASTRGEHFITYACGAHKHSTKESLMQP